MESEHKWGTEDTKVRRKGSWDSWGPLSQLPCCSCMLGPKCGAARGSLPCLPWQAAAQRGKSSTEVLWGRYFPQATKKSLKIIIKKPNKHHPLHHPQIVLSATERVNMGLEWNKITNPLIMVSICVSQITFPSLTQPLKAFYRWIPMTQAFIIPSLHKSCC